jgi:hypothetical protein
MLSRLIASEWAASGSAGPLSPSDEQSGGKDNSRLSYKPLVLLVVTIGQHGQITPTFARDEAKRLLGTIATGRDPAAERDKAKADRSLAAVLEQFMAEHVRPKLKPSTAEGYQRVARLYVLPPLGRYSIGEVQRADIARLHHEMRSKPYQANSTLAMLSKFFGWAEKHGLRPDGSNPCRHVEKFREGRRERFLSQAELSRPGDTLREAEQEKSCSPWVIAAIRLLTLTGARRNEILTLHGSTSVRSTKAFCFQIQKRDGRLSV